jgi:hypothetical protein
MMYHIIFSVLMLLYTLGILCILVIELRDDED